MRRARRSTVTAICVLGMHRSGTSSLAGALQEAGLFAGDVVKSAPHNERGNRENLRIRELNEAVLASSNGAWDHPPEQLIWDTEHARARDEIVDRFERQSGAWMFKDPRTLLTLPFWREGIADLRFVATFRHPLSVARSLRVRSTTAPDLGEHLPLEAGVRLWVEYNRVLAGLLGDEDFPLLCFDLPTADYLTQLRATIEWLRRLLGDRARLSGSEAERFYEPSLVHQDQAGAPAEPAALDLADPLNAEAVGLYRDFEERSHAALGTTLAR